ncbi:MAG: family 10 glycosylhydrolase [Anaerolineae bacterium]|nr:family 10 glycosylhydrolase [Anaerolineae bacterium]
MSSERGRFRSRGRPRAGSWTLFALLASLAFLLVVALAERSRQAPAEDQRAAVGPIVPAAALSDREDWLTNGQLELQGSGDSEAAPPGWQLFEVTEAGARFFRGPGESFLRLDCGGRTCIAGLWQRLDGLAAGGYYLEADVYLSMAPTASGAAAVRLGYDATGGVDPTSPGVTWSSQARDQGWQRVSLEIEEGGGAGTVFIAFDALSAGADCRLAGARLLGPPGVEPVTPSPTTEAMGGEPAVTDVEVRALYVSLAEMDLSDEAQLREVLDRAAAARFNTIYLQVRRLGLAYYDSAVEPVVEVLQGEEGLRWDPLARACEMAKERGLRLHAWIEVLPVWEASAPVEQQPLGHLYSLFSARFGAEWLQAGSEDGVLYASPSHPQVRTYLAAVCRDLVSRYPVDGLHFTGLEYRSHLQGDGTEALGLLLEEIGREVRAVCPEVELSAQIWPVRRDQWGWALAEAGADFGQDAASWAREGRVDVLVPALYLAEELGQAERVAALVEDWGLAGGWVPVVPAVDGGLRPFKALAQTIAEARLAGAMGVAVYDSRRLSASGYWGLLASGPFSRPAETPPLLCNRQ